MLSLNDDGSVEMLDHERNPLPTRIVRMAREQQGDFIAAWLQEQCNRWNQGIDEILNIHLDTPSPSDPVQFVPKPFEIPEPKMPTTQPSGLLGKLFRGRAEQIAQQNRKIEHTHLAEHQEWEVRRLSHLKAQESRRKFIEEDRLTDPQAMQEYLEERYSQLEWPRETQVSLQVEGSGSFVMVDVDLPEIEEMPTEHATVAARGLKINLRRRSESQRRKEYMTHVHAIAFRLIGETFSALPTVQNVLASGYSQRPDKTTGELSDDYLFSVQVERSQWTQINFKNLQAVDPTSCLENFRLRRKMTKTGVFTPIEPYTTIDDL